MGRDSWVCIATRYGLDGPAIESWWTRDFPHPSRPALGPPSFLYNGYRVFPGGKADGAWHWPPTTSSAEVNERVELHLWAFVACYRGNFTFTFTFTMSQVNNCCTVITISLLDKYSYPGTFSKYMFGYCDHFPASRVLGHSRYRTVLNVHRQVTCLLVTYRRVVGRQQL